MNTRCGGSSNVRFKGNPETNLENKLNELPEVKNSEVFVVCQKNAWVDASTFIRC